MAEAFGVAPHIDVMVGFGERDELFMVSESCVPILKLLLGLLGCLALGGKPLVLDARSCCGIASFLCLLTEVGFELLVPGGLLLRYVDRCLDAVQRNDAHLIAAEYTGLSEVGDNTVEGVEVGLRCGLRGRDRDLLVLTLADRPLDAFAAQLKFLKLGAGLCRLLVQVVGLIVQKRPGGERMCVNAEP